MLDKLIQKLAPEQTQAGAVVIRLRPPDLAALQEQPVDEDESDGDEMTACPICGEEHEPLDLPPDLVMILGHLVDQLANKEPEGDGDDEPEQDDDGDDGDDIDTDHDDDLHMMPK